jgi:hypothetical protein
MCAPIRLEREGPAATQAGRAASIGVFLAVLGGIIVRAMRSDAPSDGQNEWLVYAVGGGLSVVGLVVVIFAIKMFLASRLPETIVEVDRMPVRAGERFQVTVRQAGPIRLESLRLNLVAEQLTRRALRHSRQRRISTDRRVIHQSNVLDVGNTTILPGREIARQIEAVVPADVRPVDIEGDKRIVWRLEVWGRVRGWVDFGHRFVLEVSGARRSHRADR